MFRQMRRMKQQVSEEECVCVLREAKRGVLSLIGDGGYPYGVPIDFVYDEEAGKIYFHSAAEGHKIDAIRACGKACFTVWQDSYRKDGDWSWYVTGVIAFGRAEIVEDRAVVIDKVRKLALKYYPSAEEAEKEIARDGNRVGLIALTVEHMTGKLVHEK